MKHQSQQENMIYLVVWGLLFAVPLLSLYVRTVNDPYMVFDWTEVFLVWRKFSVFLLKTASMAFVSFKCLADSKSNTDLSFLNEGWRKGKYTTEYTRKRNFLTCSLFMWKNTY